MLTQIVEHPPGAHPTTLLSTVSFQRLSRAYIALLYI